MAQDGNQILRSILHVVTQIRDNTAKSSAGPGTSADTKTSEDKSASAKSAGMMSGFLGKDAKSSDIKEMGSALKELSKGVGDLSIKLKKWEKIPEKTKASLVNFIRDLLSVLNKSGEAEEFHYLAHGMSLISNALPKLSKGIFQFGLLPKKMKSSLPIFMRELLDVIKKPKEAEEFYLLASGMLVIADALPELAKGVFRFGLMQKTGLVRATSIGITSLGSAVALIGNPGTLPFVLAGAAALAAVGVALMGISKVLDSIAKIMLAFSASIIMLVGAIKLASILFETTPVQSMMIIAGVVIGLGVVFAGLGILSPLIALGGTAIATMGVGLTTLGVGFVAFYGGMSILENKFGMGIFEAIENSIKPIYMMGAVFAGLGMASPLIILGGLAAKRMGEGLLWLSGGMLAMGLVGTAILALTRAAGSSPGEIYKQMAMGIMYLGGAMAILGLLSILIIPGAAALILVAVSIGLFALVMLGINAVIAKLGGEKGLEQAGDNIALLIGGVLKGVKKGIATGLMGEEDDKGNFFRRGAIMAKNAFFLIAGIVILMGVSQALTMFAFAVRAFTKAGHVRVITGYDEKGQAIFGESVAVVDAGEKIAKSIGSFFTVLSETFKDPSIIPNPAKMAKIANILMGKKATRLGLIKIPGTQQPSLLDAITGFAEVIKVFADIQGLPIYDKNGEVTGYVKPEDVAKRVAQSIGNFFSEFEKYQSTFENINTDVTSKLAVALLGSKQSKGLLNIRSSGEDKAGILEPLIKFSELLEVMGADPNKLIYKDDKGEIHKIDVAKTASAMVTSLVDFAKGVNIAVGDLDDDLLSGGRRTGDKSTVINTIGELNEQFKKLSNQRKGLAEVAKSIASLSTSIGSLSDELVKLDGEKLALVTNAKAGEESNSRREARQERREDRKEARQEKKESKSSPAQAQVNQLNEQQLADSIGSSVAAALAGKQFTFDFQGENKGIFTLE
jgi:hypothetical protein